MKFLRTERYGKIELTQRRQRAIETKPVRDRQRLADKHPLFADQLPTAEPVDVQEVLAKRQAHSDSFERDMRASQARFWRRARHDYFASNPQVRAAILSEWNAWRGPRSSTNFGYIVDKHTGTAEARQSRFRAERTAMALRINSNSEPTASLFD